MLWKDMAVHDQTSVKLSEKCKVCGELVRPDEMARHRRDSAELHVQLLEDMLEAETAPSGANNLACESSANRPFNSVAGKLRAINKPLAWKARQFRARDGMLLRGHLRCTLNGGGQHGCHT